MNNWKKLFGDGRFTVAGTDGCYMDSISVNELYQAFKARDKAEAKEKQGRCSCGWKPGPGVAIPCDNIVNGPWYCPACNGRIEDPIKLSHGVTYCTRGTLEKRAMLCGLCMCPLDKGTGEPGIVCIHRGGHGEHGSDADLCTHPSNKPPEPECEHRVWDYFTDAWLYFKDQDHEHCRDCGIKLQ